MAPSSNDERLLALSDVIVSTKVRLEALDDRLGHLRNRLNKLIEDVDKLEQRVTEQLEKRVSELEYSAKARGASWKWILAIVGGLGAIAGIVQAIVGWASR